MTQSTETELPHWPPVNSTRNPLTPLDDAERQRYVGPVTRVLLPTGITAWLVSRHTEVRQLLRHPAFSSDLHRPGFPLLRPLPPEATRDLRGAFLQMDGAAHTRLRRMLTAEFMIKNVRRIEPLIHQTIDEALDRPGRRRPPGRPGVDGRAARAVQGDLPPARRPLRRPRLLPVPQPPPARPSGAPGAAPTRGPGATGIPPLADRRQADPSRRRRRPAQPAGPRSGRAG